MNPSPEISASENLAAERSRSRFPWADFGVLYALVGVVIIALVVYPAFSTPRNLENILSQSSPLMIVGIAVTIVLISGNFDFSVGAIFGIGGLVFAKVVATEDYLIAVLAAVGIGALFGLINALLVAILRLSSFLATFATGLGFLGLGFVYETTRVPIFADTAKVLGNSDVLGAPTELVIVLVLAVLITLALSKTAWGRSIYAAGGNFEAARLAGLRVRMVVGSTYVVSGVLCAVAGVLAASRMATGAADVGAEMPLNAIAIAVIGGTSIWGGRGAVWRTLVGALVLAVLGNVFNALGAPTSTKEVVSGMAILAAVAIQKRPAGRI